MNFLFSTMPALGHIGPALPIAAGLVGRGHCVWWHTGPDHAGLVEATGARFVPYEHANAFGDPPAALRQGGLAALGAAIEWLLVSPMLGQLRDYESILEEFPADVIFAGVVTGALLAHERGGPPWAGFGTGPLRLPSPELRVLSHAATAAFNRGRASIGLPPLPGRTSVFDLLTSPFLHVQATVAAVEPYDEVPPQVHFVGALPPPEPPGQAKPAWWDDLDGARPVVLVAQGTVSTDARQLVLPALRGLAEHDVLVVALAPDAGALGPLPDNARVAPFLPYTALLPRVDVMVTNGGYGGVNQALAHGVPLVAAGQSEDHAEVCARVAYAGAGIDLQTGSPSAEQLSAAVLSVLRDPAYRHAAQRLRAEFARHDGPAEAASLLERLAASAAPVV